MPSKVAFQNFWALSRIHFNPRLAVWAKLGLSRAHNKFMPENITRVVLLEFHHGQKLGINLPWLFTQGGGVELGTTVPNTNPSSVGRRIQISENTNIYRKYEYGHVLSNSCNKLF